MKLLKSFGYAFRGMYSCMCLERNFRIHMVAVITVLIFAVLYALPIKNYPPLFLSMALVMGFEAVNTAIERVVDLNTQEHCPLARVAKDVAAGAVLISALGAVAVAATTFSDGAKWLAFFQRFHSIPFCLGVVFYIVLFAGFVFFFPAPKEKIVLHKEEEA